jgi:hypothetical protein
MSGKVTSPEEFFGFQMGADRKIARWDKIVEYFYLLEKQSNKIKVINMGPSTEGNPFLLSIITSAKNLKNLEKIRKMNAKLSDPRGLKEKKIEGLIQKGKAVVCQSMSLHATEIGGTQMAPELAYDLLTKEDEETQRILENVVFLMIPSFNPDGQIIVTDWYNKWLGTEYEGIGPPVLYHKYVGHDNNRDAFMTNMVESKYAAKILFTDWHPQAYQDHHHMGSYGARLYIAPYCEPIRPYADPLIWRELSWYGAHMAYKLEENEKTGIINDAQYAGWGHFGFHWIGNFHNITSMLTESASARLATPVYVHPSQLTSGGDSTLRGFAHYKPQTNFPHPWLGGWWRLRDIVEQQKIASWALLDMAARNKETVLRNAYMKAKRQTERGAEETPKAYIISPFQHDSLTAAKLVEKLLVQGIEIKRAKKDFTVDGLTYPKGTYIIFLAQPKMGLIKNLLGKTLYPDDPWSREGDGSPRRPYDTATDTMAEFMGVRVDPIESIFKGSFEVVTEPPKPAGSVGSSTFGYLFDSRLNDSFKAANILLGKGVKLMRVDEPVTVGGAVFPAGAFVASVGSEGLLKELAQDIGIDFHPFEKELTVKVHDVKKPRVAMYQRYYGGNMDEGWTRFALEQFAFPYTTVMDKEIKEGNLAEKYDVLILPSDATPIITGENLEEYYARRARGVGAPPKYPPEYRSGIGKEGVENLKKFVEEGGKLVTFNEACEFAIEKFGLRLFNVLKDVKPKDFFCPGSTLKAKVDNANPFGYGMPKDALLLFYSSLAFDIVPSDANENYEIIVQYPERGILQSGWLVGEEKIANKVAMVSAKQGKGKVILIGFRAQHRAQTHGTFKLLFNILLN